MIDPIEITPDKAGEQYDLPEDDLPQDDMPEDEGEGKQETTAFTAEEALDAIAEADADLPLNELAENIKDQLVEAVEGIIEEAAEAAEAVTETVVPDPDAEQEIWEPGELAKVYPSEVPVEEPTTIHRTRLPGDEIKAEPTVERDIKAAATEYSVSQLEMAHQFLNKYGIRTDKLSDLQVMEKLQKIQDAREVASQVLSRGRVMDTVDRILEDLPDGLVGEFKRDNDLDISRARALHWQVYIDKELAQQTLTAADDGCVRLGDLILMVIPEETYVGNRLARADRLAERRVVRKRKGKPKQGDEIMGADPKVPIIQL